MIQTATKKPSNIQTFSLPSCSVDLSARHIVKDGTVIALTATEASLLEYLVQHAGRVVTMEELLVNVWGYSPLSRTRTVYVNICFLRNKIEQDPRQPQYIRTARGYGYWFKFEEGCEQAA